MPETDIAAPPPVRVVADAAGVAIGDAYYERSELLTAHVRRGATPAVVILPVRGAPFEIAVPNEAAGDALLESMRFDPNIGHLSVRVRAPHAATVALLVAVPLIWLIGGLFAFGPWWFYTIFAVFLASLIPARVTVGPAGVELSWLWARRRVAYRDLARVQLAERVLLHLKSKSVVALGETPEASRVAMHIRRAIGAIAPPADEATCALLAQRDLPVKDWVHALRTWMDRSTYRDTPFTPERLWRTLVDEHADTRIRVAAAVALTATHEDDIQARLRAVREASSIDPKLRVALEAVDGNDPALFEAIGRLDEDAWPTSDAKPPLGAHRER